MGGKIYICRLIEAVIVLKYVIFQDELGVKNFDSRKYCFTCKIGWTTNRNAQQNHSLGHNGLHPFGGPTMLRTRKTIIVACMFIYIRSNCSTSLQ